MIEVVDAIVDGALHGVSLCVERGEVVALIGHNGSGKSTLGRLVCGAQLPQSGAVCVDGRLRPMCGGVPLCAVWLAMLAKILPTRPFRPS